MAKTLQEIMKDTRVKQTRHCSDDREFSAKQRRALRMLLEDTYSLPSNQVDRINILADFVQAYVE